MLSLFGQWRPQLGYGATGIANRSDYAYTRGIYRNATAKPNAAAAAGAADLETPLPDCADTADPGTTDVSVASIASSPEPIIVVITVNRDPSKSDGEASEP